jgi:hypothetical protein
MKMEKFKSFSGIITIIDDFWVDETGKGAGCYKLMSVEDISGTLVNFMVTPATYFVEHVRVAVGDRVTGFYDANAPIPFIYPPQYKTIVMASDNPSQSVKVDYFNSQLVSSDNKLRLNIGPGTQILLENGQSFNRNPRNRNLIVLYGITTMSIPAQTTPYKIIVMC